MKHVIDDESQVEHLHKLRYIRIPDRVFSKKSRQYSRALKRNASVLLSRGEYVVFFDDDDWRSLDSAITQLEYMKNSQSDICTLQGNFYIVLVCFDSLLCFSSDDMQGR